MHVKSGGFQDKKDKPDAPQAQLSLYSLGTFEVRVNGRPITDQFRTDKERGLLTYLIWESHRPHRRETLGELLWPEREEGTARTNLRQAILGVRRAIGDIDSPTPFLSITNEFVQLNPSKLVWLDAIGFGGHIKFTQTHPHQGLETCAGCVQHLESAVDLYRGDFLESISIESQGFQEWVVFKRETLFRDLLFALQTLTAYYANQGDYETAHKYALKHVVLYPLEEKAHRQLMRLLALSGHRSAALEQYQLCRRLLQDELGIAPDPQTQSLYDQIRQGHPLTLPATAPSPLPNRVDRLPSHNLPSPLTSFIGYEEETSQLLRCMQNPVCRLITLIGPPGAGKTRLAIHIARSALEHFPDGVWFIPAETISPGDGLMPAIAKTIGFFGNGKPLKNTLIHYLKTKKTLIILDSFEHLSKDGAPLLELLGQASGVKIMITSRERLNYQVACIFEINGLAYPSSFDLEHATEYPAIRLFLNRAFHRPGQMTLPTKDLHEVIKICQLLDGLPLAVELAAARANKLTYEQIAEGIQQNLDLLKTSMLDVQERHQSMYAAINQSWQLLTEEEKNIFARLGVFQGKFSFEAAEQIADATPSILANLIDKSLLEMEEARYYRLQITLRNFAAEKLRETPEDMQVTQIKFARFYMDFLRRCKLKPGHPIPFSVLQRLEPEMNNLRAAWQWVTDHKDIARIAQGLESFLEFFNHRIQLQDGEKIFRMAVEALSHLPCNSETCTPVILSHAGLAWFLARESKYEEAKQSFERSLQCAETLPPSPDLLVFPYFGSAYVAYKLGEFAKAQTHFEASIKAGEQSRENHWSNLAKLYLTALKFDTGALPDPKNRLLDILHLFEQTENSLGRLLTLRQLGDITFAQNNPSQAYKYYQRGLTLAQEVEHRWLEASLQLKLAMLSSQVGDYTVAQTYAEQGLYYFERLGDQAYTAIALRELGGLAALQGNFMAAHRFFAQALEIATNLSQRSLALDILSGIACMFANTQRQEQAWELLGLIQTHPATQRLTRQRATLLPQTCITSPDIQKKDAALQRGSKLDLDTVITELRLSL